MARSVPHRKRRYDERDHNGGEPFPRQVPTIGDTMTNAEVFIIFQTIWDVFLMILACGLLCYWGVFWLLVLNDEPLNPENNDLFTKGVLFFRRLRNRNQ